MEVLQWVSPVICALLFIGCLGFYLDSKGARAALAAWQAATATQLGELSAQLIDHAARLLILEGGGQPPPAGSAPRPSLSLARSALQEERAAAAPASGPGPMTPMTAGGEGRRLSSRPPPPVIVLGAPDAPETETPEQIRARLEAAEDEREYRPRQVSSPTLVSAGNAPPSSEPRPTYLDLMTDLSDAELARVDAAAARRGVTREAMFVILARTALDEAEAAARLPAPTTPPNAPANDREPLSDGDGDKPPPPSGKRRG